MLRENPIKEARKKLGFTISQTALNAGVNRLVIIRTEQGTYASIPPRLYSFLVDRMGDSDPSLSADYQRWLGEKRIDSFGRLTEQLPRFNPETHPFTQWREASDLGVTEFCKLFCVHLSTVIRYEGKLEQQTTPDQILEALSESGYSADVVAELQIRYKIYRLLALAIRSNDSARIADAWVMANEHSKMIQAA